VGTNNMRLLFGDITSSDDSLMVHVKVKDAKIEGK